MLRPGQGQIRGVVERARWSAEHFGSGQVGPAPRAPAQRFRREQAAHTGLGHAGMALTAARTATQNRVLSSLRFGVAHGEVRLVLHRALAGQEKSSPRLSRGVTQKFRPRFKYLRSMCSVTVLTL